MSAIIKTNLGQCIFCEGNVTHEIEYSQSGGWDSPVEYDSSANIYCSNQECILIELVGLQEACNEWDGYWGLKEVEKNIKKAWKDFKKNKDFQIELLLEYIDLLQKVYDNSCQEEANRIEI